MLDNFFLFFTSLGNYAFIWFGLAVFIAFQQKNKAKIIILSTTYAIALSFLITTALKLLFRLPRPTDIRPLTADNCPVDFSFPSGHASTSFAAAIMLAHFDPKRKWLYFILAGLISYSRIYLNCHRVIDVVGGAVLGIVMSAVVLKITSNQSKPVAKKKKAR